MNVSDLGTVVAWLVVASLVSACGGGDGREFRAKRPGMSEAAVRSADQLLVGDASGLRAPTDTLTSYTVSEFLAAAPDSGRHEVHGFVVAVSPCPPCPNFGGVVPECMPCAGEYVTLAANPSVVPVGPAEDRSDQFTVRVAHIRTPTMSGRTFDLGLWESRAVSPETGESETVYAKVDLGRAYEAIVIAPNWADRSGVDAPPFTHVNTMLGSIEPISQR